MRVLAHLIKRPGSPYYYIQWKHEGESDWRRASTRERHKGRARDRMRAFIDEREALGPDGGLARADATLEEVGTKFLAYIENRSSAAWSEACGYYLASLYDFLRPSRPFRTIGVDDIEAFLTHRIELVKKTTVRKEFYALQQLFRFGVSPGRYRHNNPMSDLQPPRADDAVPHDRILAPAEIGRLLEAALVSRGRVKGVLLAEWIAVTYLSFMRSGESKRLAWDAIDFDSGTVQVVNDPAGRQHTKTAAERLVPMVPLLRAVLQGLPRHVSSPYVFFRRDGGPWKAVRNGFAGAVDRAELNPVQRAGESDAQFRQRHARQKVTPHTLRHSALTLLAEHGTDRWDIMRWAGHKTQQASERYIHLAGTRKRQITQVPVDEIPFVESEVFEAHVYNHVYSRGQERRRG